MMHLDFLLLIYLDVYDDLVLVGRIVFLVDEDLRILKALVVKVTFDKRFCTVYYIRGDLSSFNHADSFFQVLAFRFFHSGIMNVGHAGPHGQMNGQPNLPVFFFVVGDADVRE